MAARGSGAFAEELSVLCSSFATDWFLGLSGTSTLTRTIFEKVQSYGQEVGD